MKLLNKWALICLLCFTISGVKAQGSDKVKSNSTCTIDDSWFEDMRGDSEYLCDMLVDQDNSHGHREFLEYELDIPYSCELPPGDAKAFNTTTKEVIFMESAIAIYMADKVHPDRRTLSPDTKVTQDRVRAFFQQSFGEVKCDYIGNKLSLLTYLDMRRQNTFNQALMSLVVRYPDIDFTKLIDPVTGDDLDTYFKKKEARAYKEYNTKSGKFSYHMSRCMRHIIRGKYAEEGSPEHVAGNFWSRNDIHSMCTTYIGIYDTSTIKNAQEAGRPHLGQVHDRGFYEK